MSKTCCNRGVLAGLNYRQCFGTLISFGRTLYEAYGSMLVTAAVVKSVAAYPSLRKISRRFIDH
jgi:hypothetical protein